VRSYVEAHLDEIASSGGWKALGRTCGQMKQTDELKWADANAFKKFAEVVFADKFGDKAQADAAAKEAAAKAKATKVAAPAKPLAEVSLRTCSDSGYREPSVLMVVCSGLSDLRNTCAGLVHEPVPVGMALAPARARR